MWYNRKITLIIFVAFLTACNTVNIPDAYKLRLSEIQTNPYGSWINIYRNADNDSLAKKIISGELLCFDSDTLYILETDSLVTSTFAGNVVKAELFTHRNQAGNYGGLTGSLLIPNIIGALVHASEYGGNFLALGIPVAIIGFAQVILEKSTPARNIPSYPSNPNINEFKKFARYPAGKPQNMNFTCLTLKK